MVEVLKIANKPEWKVTLEKKVVGKIVRDAGQFQYIPKGQRVGGEKFTTLNAAVASLRSD